MRRAARTDAPHKAIVSALRKVGCQVLDLSRVGRGCPDLLVRVPGQLQEQNLPVIFRGAIGFLGPQYLLLEVKTGRHILNPRQRKFKSEWPEVRIVHSIIEALQAVGIQP